MGGRLGAWLRWKGIAQTTQTRCFPPLIAPLSLLRLASAKEQAKVWGDPLERRRQEKILSLTSPLHLIISAPPIRIQHKLHWHSCFGMGQGIGLGCQSCCWTLPILHTFLWEWGYDNVMGSSWMMSMVSLPDLDFFPMLKLVCKGCNCD